MFEKERKQLDVLMYDFCKRYAEIFVWGYSYAGGQLYEKLRRNGISVRGIISKEGGGVTAGQNILRAADVLENKNVGVVVINGSTREEIESLFPEQKNNFLYIGMMEFNEEFYSGVTEDERIHYYDYSCPQRAEDAWLSRFINHYFPDIMENFHIYGVYGSNRKVRLTSNGIKIFHATETLGRISNYFRNPETSPYSENLEYVDLSVTYENVDGENHMQFPWHMVTRLVSPTDTLEDIRKKIKEINEKPHYKITDECACVCMHDNWGTRTMVVENVKDIFDIKFPGNWRHNTDELIRRYKDNKIEYLKHFRFNICAENMNWKDYCTEKLVDTFKADCIPLYYGAENCPYPEVFNQDAIIFFDPKSNNYKSRKLVRDIVDHPKAYEEFISQPKFMPHAAEYIYENFIQRLYRKMDCLTKIHHRVRSSFSFIGTKNTALGISEKLDVKHDIVIEKQSSNFNFYRYNLPVANARYCLHLSDIVADYDNLTVGVYDFKNEVKVKYTVVSTREDIYFSFDVGEEIEQWSICIYAGISGHTMDQSLSIGTFEISVMPLRPMCIEDSNISPPNENENIDNPYAQEVYWAEIYNSIIKESEWLQHKAITPGGLQQVEVGYAFLSTLYRILDQVHPTNILEMRLGQDTKLTTQYARYYGANHAVVDHDVEFVKHFRQHWRWLSKQTTIYIAKRDSIAENGGFAATKYFGDIIRGKKYDFVILKRGRGKQEKAYGDILAFVPDLLENNFLIMLDFGNGASEQQLIRNISLKLSGKNVAVSFKKVSCVERDIVLLSSPEWANQFEF